MAAHQFQGSGYYSIQVEVDGEGIASGSRANRVKRRTQRTVSGGVFIVSNFTGSVTDRTPPDRITDLLADFGSERNGNTIFTLSWTAPGNDLNVGRASNYTFYVSNDSSTSNLQVLPTITRVS
ncbi:CLCA4 [Bugula neritina]|uniref:CLCA4 n=1 Tax=Bugula neritina TaxID=10212 RepID=A0A7J7KQB5_BUGNE|nr:CLCA4 [Bugula neritina]